MGRALAPTQEKIVITMLGGFTMSCAGRSVSDSAGRIHQVWNLLEYLIVNREREVSRDELSEILWDEEECENPQNALKNLVYRARGVLSDAGIGAARDLVIYHRGSYRWSGEIPCSVDTEEFERRITEFRDTARDPDERIARAQVALALYRGEFLPLSSNEKWVIPLSVYYKSLYFSCVTDLCDLLFEKGQFAAAVRICAHAMEIDQFEEGPHLCYLKALEAQGKAAAALEHYNYASELFYREMGVQLSDEIQEVYRRISDGFNDAQTDLQSVKRVMLGEEAMRHGAYCCNYEVFRNLYRIEARAAVRTGQVSFIGMISIKAPSGAPSLEGEALQSVMDDLLDVICGSLRKNDVVSRLSVSQYILLLPTQTLENAYAVLDRIKKRYREERHKYKAELTTSAQALDPIS